MEEEILQSNQIFDIQHGILISVTSSALHILKIRKKPIVHFSALIY